MRHTATSHVSPCVPMYPMVGGGLATGGAHIHAFLCTFSLWSVPPMASPVMTGGLV